MKLRELLAVIPDDSGVTIHIDGQLDGHYVYVHDIEHDLYDREVLELSGGYRADIDLFIRLEVSDDD